MYLLSTTKIKIRKINKIKVSICLPVNPLFRHQNINSIKLQKVTSKCNKILTLTRICSIMVVLAPLDKIISLPSHNCCNKTPKMYLKCHPLSLCSNIKINFISSVKKITKTSKKVRLEHL